MSHHTLFPGKRRQASNVPRRHLLESLESRLLLDASGIASNPCAPDLVVNATSAIAVTSPLETVELNLFDSLAVTATDTDGDGNPITETIRLQLDPDDNPANATLTADGDFRWTPTADQTGMIEFIVIAIDSGTPPLADAEVFTIEVRQDSPPDLASIPDATAAVNEELVVILTASDPDGDAILSFNVDPDNSPAGVTISSQVNTSAGATAELRFTPTADLAGQSVNVSVLATSTAANGADPKTDNETFTIDVMSVVANDDFYDGAADTDLVVDAATGVLANDTDSDAGELTASVLIGSTNGTVSLASDGSFTYSPNASFLGTDTFTYEAKASDGDISQATVSIAITGQANNPPVVEARTVTFDQGTTLMLDAATGLLSNSTDEDGDTLTATLLTGPGGFVIGSDGSVEYTAPAEFVGTFDVTYTVSDGTAATEGTLVVVVEAVNAANEQPSAVPETFLTDEGVTLTVAANEGVLINDTDPNLDTLTAELISGTSNGSLTLEPDGAFTYEPNPSFSGTDTFRYAANDGELSSQTVVVAILVRDVNAAPMGVADSYNATLEQTLTVNAADGVLSNDTDDGTDPLTASVVTPPTNGTLVLESDGSFTYTPNAEFVGTDSFTYEASDGVESSTTTTVSINVSDPNAFVVSASAVAGSSVGTVQPDGDFDATALYQIVDATIPDELILNADDHISGEPTSEVVLTEYYDFQCPACRSWHPIVSDLEDAHDGELLVVRRHLPLESIHLNARAAARAAEAADRQNEFLAMGDLLFDNQGDWNTLGDPTPVFEGYATSLGLDLDQFRADVADVAIDDGITEDATGFETAFGPPSTPTFFLQGERISPTGAGNLDTLIQTEIDEFDAVFKLDRNTGELIVADTDRLAAASSPIDVAVLVRDADGNSETINATVSVGATASGVASAFAEVDDWLN